MKYFFVWAHRGASALAPENTLAAFQAAEAAGADGVELDVQLSRDGVPVVLHDARVDRTSDGRGAVAVLPLAEIRKLDVGSWFEPAFAGERLPTLDEVLAWGGRRLRFNIEIKDAAAGRAVLNQVRRHPRAAVLVSSFDHALLTFLRRAAPRLPMAFLYQEADWPTAVRRAAACRAESFHPRYDILCPALVSACHRRGLAVYPWVVDARDDVERCLALAVDGVFCNDPEQVVGWLRNRRRKHMP